MDTDVVRKCGDCRHWRRDAVEVIDLSKIQGHCVEGPPSCVPIGKGQMFVSYPILPSSFMACSRFAHKIVDSTTISLVGG